MHSPFPTPLCEERLPDIVTVSRVVIGASIDCDIDMPDTSILGKGIGSLSMGSINIFDYLTTRPNRGRYILTQNHRRTSQKSPSH